MKIKDEKFLTKFIFLLLLLSLWGNIMLIFSKSDLEGKVTHLSWNIVELHNINMTVLEKTGYRAGLSDQEIEDCQVYEEMLQQVINSAPEDTSSGGIYGVEIIGNSLFANYAHARYSSWDIKYLGHYGQYIKNCY